LLSGCLIILMASLITEGHLWMSGQDSTLTKHFTFPIPNSLPDTYEYCCFLAMEDSHPAMATAVFAIMLHECQEHGCRNLRITLYKHFTTLNLEFGIWTLTVYTHIQPGYELCTDPSPLFPANDTWGNSNISYNVIPSVCFTQTEKFVSWKKKHIKSTVRIHICSKCIQANPQNRIFKNIIPLAWHKFVMQLVNYNVNTETFTCY
jgi:hypothetical protein